MKQLLDKPRRAPWRRGLAFLAALGATVSAEPLRMVPAENLGLSSVKLAEIDQKAQSLVEDRKLAGCVVCVARKGKLVYLKSFGYADLESKTPMREDAIFRIYSMTKAITSAVALMLVEEGKLGLDEPIGKMVPELANLTVLQANGERVPVEREPTVRDLLRHTAGFTYGYFGFTEVDQLYRDNHPLESPDLETMVRKLAKLPLLYQPGNQWVYSISTDVLGHVIERVTRQRLDHVFQERILGPLGMVDTGFHVPKEKLARLTTLYSKNLLGRIKRADAMQHQVVGPVTFFSGGGGLVSTARDYMRFLQMIHSGGRFGDQNLLRPHTVKLMTTDQLPDTIAYPLTFLGTERSGVGFGLGFAVRTAPTTWDPAAQVGEYGWGGVASTHYWLSPKDDVAVVTMEQTMPFAFMLEFALKGTIYEAVLE